MRPGDSLDVTIEKGVYRGLGLARHDGQVVFLPRGLPGDRWRVRIAAVERGYARAAPEALVHPGPDRRDAPCPFASACGGCAYQELEYPAQLRLKEAVLRESLRRAGAAWDGPIALHPSPEAGWRARATFHVQARGREVRLGLHSEGSRRVVDIARCLQLGDALNALLENIRPALAERPGVAARVTEVTLAEDQDGGGSVACLEGRLTVEDVPELLALGESPGLRGLGMLAGEPGRQRFVLLRGAPHVSFAALGVVFRAHVRSFFQANRYLVEPLAARVAELVPPRGVVLDLYAGVGLFALTLAGRAESVLAVEASPIAVADALANAQRALAARTRFVEGDVAEALARTPVAGEERVILDPPRGGAGVELCRAIVARSPAVIVYVSCDPPTLGRDLAALAARGYRPQSVDAFDLFPDTFHLETVVRLIRA